MNIEHLPACCQAALADPRIVARIEAEAIRKAARTFPSMSAARRHLIQLAARVEAKAAS
jgi:hypothetical protein